MITKPPKNSSITTTIETATITREKKIARITTAKITLKTTTTTTTITIIITKTPTEQQ